MSYGNCSRAANLNLSGVEARSPRELRVSVPRETLAQFADYLRALNNGAS